MLCDVLKELREKRGLSRQQVADAIGIKKRALETYEYGERDVSTETLSKFADFYGVTTDYLLGRPEAKPPEDPIESLCNALNISQEEKQFIFNYFNMPPEMRLNTIHFLSKLTSND